MVDGGPSEVDRFAEYYERESVSPEAIQRFRSIQNVVLGVLLANNSADRRLDVADIGCGAGTQCTLWAEDGHHVEGLDINEPLISIARTRAAEKGHDIVYHVGSAEQLPWADRSIDVCLVPELLEHVLDWRLCIREFDRILRPGGVIYISTNNVLCPIQEEFDLPLYSWYPGRLKRRYERLAVTTAPHLVNYAKYPAVHWFSYYSLRKVFADLGYSVQDRFDTVRLEDKGLLPRSVIGAVRAVPPLRFLAHVCTPYTAIVATKHPGPPMSTSADAAGHA